jgi:hypothetical protein
MSTRQLLSRARRCHRSANAKKARAISSQYSTREAAMHDLGIAEKLEALAEALERQALGNFPRARL